MEFWVNSGLRLGILKKIYLFVFLFHSIKNDKQVSSPTFSFCGVLFSSSLTGNFTLEGSQLCVRIYYAWIYLQYVMYMACITYSTPNRLQGNDQIYSPLILSDLCFLVAFCLQEIPFIFLPAQTYTHFLRGRKSDLSRFTTSEPVIQSAFYTCLQLIPIDLSG